LNASQQHAFSKESLTKRNRLVPFAPPSMEEIEKIQAGKIEETKEQKP
jgi:hypothetical protein